MGFADYCHTQKSPLSTLLAILGLTFVGIAWLVRQEPLASLVLCVVALIIFAMAASFHRLTVVGNQSGLRVQFGPLPLFGVSIPYESMRGVESSRSSLIDGWGIHYVPGRGWTYNLWGFGCVLIHRHDQSCIRIGTDDVDGLLTFLQTKLNELPPPGDT